MDKQSYPSMPSSLVSFSEGDTFLDIIAVKLTNYKQRRHILKVNAF